MADHTPGPWQGCLHLRSDADEKCGCGYRGGIWSLTAEVQICEMAAGRNPGDDMIPVSDRATQIADHWLIAAAPDLYEAAKFAWKRLDVTGDDCDAADKLFAALMKAEGRS